jgi:hypothetical protein
VRSVSLARDDEKPVSRPARMAREKRKILFTVGRYAGGNQESFS